MPSLKEGLTDAAEILADVLLLLAVWIDYAFTEYLLLSNIISAGVLLGLGDFTVQTIELFRQRRRSRRGYDWVRNRHTFVVGFVLGVFNHYWYAILEHFLQGHTLHTVLYKIAWDQAIAGPFFSSAFLVGMGALEGKTVTEIYAEWSNKFLGIYKVDWMFWPPAQFINFYLIPHRFRVFYVNLATFLWNTFLSYARHEQGSTGRRGQGYNGYRHSMHRHTSPIRSSRRKSNLSRLNRQRSRPASLTRSRRRGRARIRVLRKIRSAGKQGDGKLKVWKEPKHDISRNKAGNNHHQILTTKKVGVDLSKTKKNVKLQPNENELSFYKKFRVVGGEKPTFLMAVQNELKEIRAQVDLMSKEFTERHAELDESLQDTQDDIKELQDTCESLRESVDETRRGAVNIARQIAQRVREERQTCIEEAKASLMNMMMRIEQLVRDVMKDKAVCVVKE